MTPLGDSHVGSLPYEPTMLDMGGGGLREVNGLLAKIDDEGGD